MPAVHTYTITEEREIRVSGATSPEEALAMAQESLDSNREDNLANRRPLPSVKNVNISKDTF